jgi:hypothetical protein
MENSRRLQAVRNPPFVAWDLLEPKLKKEWKPGDHVTLIGPTGSGKTHLALALAKICKFSLVIATKRKDPLLDTLIKKHLVIADLAQMSEMAKTEDGIPIHRRVMFWPQFSDKVTQSERLEKQREMVSYVLDWAEKTGNWAIVLDELMWVSRNLKLERELEAVWFQGRTQGVSLIGAAQRPTHVPRLAYSQATYFFIWQTGDRADMERLRDISAGFPRRMIENSVMKLDWNAHECLFVDTKKREICRTIGPEKL